MYEQAPCRFWGRSLGLMLLFGIIGAEPVLARLQADTTFITVDVRDEHQRIDGFGANALTLIYQDEDYLGDLRPEAIRLAFQEVGLTLGRVGVGLVEAPAQSNDPWGNRGNDNDDPFLIDADGFNFTHSDHARQSVVALAQPYGFTNITPGDILDLRQRLAFLQDIRAQDYNRYLQEAAEHVVAVVRQWNEGYGYDIRLLYLFNEPTSGNRSLRRPNNNNEEANREIVDLVKAMGQRLAQEGFPEVKFIVPNEATVSRSYEVAQALLADPVARSYVGAIGYHPYPYESTYARISSILATSGQGHPDPPSVQQREDLRDLAQHYDIPLWMTEVSTGPGNAEYPFGSMNNLRGRAIHIHDELQYGGVSAFLGMNTIWDSRSHAEHFAGREIDFFSEHSSIILTDLDARESYITGMGYAVGHYARWVKPGAVRLASSSSNPLVLVNAFKDEARSRMVVVLVNNESHAVDLQVAVQGAALEGVVTGETSYENKRWQPLAASPLRPNGIEALFLPAESVTTIAVPLDAASLSGDADPVPSSFQLGAYPNPFVEETQIHFQLERPMRVELSVTDILGRRVTMLAQGTLGAGGHTFLFDGAALPPGVYFCQLRTPSRVEHRQMVRTRLMK